MNQILLNTTIYYNSAVPATPVFPEEPPATTTFTDVPTDAYYADAVTWSKSVGVTEGKSATEFGPNDMLTRADAMTFLWRAAGCPAPLGVAASFSDVPAGQYYTDAILWAVEKRISRTAQARQRFLPLNP